jgi:hypothetical protein
MVIDRRVAEVGLIRRPEDSIPLGCRREDARVTRTHAEFLDIDDTNYVVAVIAQRLDLLCFDVFVSKQLHRRGHTVSSGTTRFAARSS